MCTLSDFAVCTQHATIIKYNDTRNEINWQLLNVHRNNRQERRTRQHQIIIIFVADIKYYIIQYPCREKRSNTNNNNHKINSVVKVTHTVHRRLRRRRQHWRGTFKSHSLRHSKREYKSWPRVEKKKKIKRKNCFWSKITSYRVHVHECCIHKCVCVLHLSDFFFLFGCSVLVWDASN